MCPLQGQNILSRAFHHHLWGLGQATWGCSLLLLQTRWAGEQTAPTLSWEIYGATGGGLSWPCAVQNGPQGGDNKSSPLFFTSLPPHKQLRWLVSQLHALLAWPPAGTGGTLSADFSTLVVEISPKL